jgi:hypothetical protein
MESQKQSLAQRKSRDETQKKEILKKYEKRLASLEKQDKERTKEQK